MTAVVVEVKSKTCSIDVSTYTRSKYQKYGIAQSVYVPQGFSPVTFATGTDGTMGTVEKKRR